MRITALVLLIAGLLVPTPIAAQQLPKEAQADLAQFVKEKDRDRLSTAASTELVVLYFMDRLRGRRPDTVSDLRTDLEIGATDSGGASTSVLARPGITDLFSAALESGAVIRKTDDNAVTFTVNALALSQFMSAQMPRGCGALDETCRYGAGRWLRGLSGAVTFSMATPAAAVAEGEAAPTSEPVLVIGGRRLQGISARYEWFVRERDEKTLQKLVSDAAPVLSPAAAAFLKVGEPLHQRLTTVLSGWTDTTTKVLNETATIHASDSASSLQTALERVLLERFEIAYHLIGDDPGLMNAISAADVKATEYRVAMNTLLADKLYRKALTVDYAKTLPSNQPVFQQVKGVFSTPLGRKPTNLTAETDPVPPAMLTGNVGVSWFRPATTETPVWKLRDSQLSVGIDWSPAAWGVLRPTYTVAYYFQYMIENGVIQLSGDAITPGGSAIPLPKAAKEVLNTKGAIHVVQLRMNLPVGNGVSFPFGASYSNRTELITGRPFWQGHVGVSYDFSALKNLGKK